MKKERERLINLIEEKKEELVQKLNNNIVLIQNADDEIILYEQWLNLFTWPKEHQGRRQNILLFLKSYIPTWGKNFDNPEYKIAPNDIKVFANNLVFSFSIVFKKNLTIQCKNPIVLPYTKAFREERKESLEQRRFLLESLKTYINHPSLETFKEYRKYYIKVQLGENAEKLSNIKKTYYAYKFGNYSNIPIIETMVQTEIRGVEKRELQLKAYKIEERNIINKLLNLKKLEILDNYGWDIIIEGIDYYIPENQQKLSYKDLQKIDIEKINNEIVNTKKIS